MQQVFDTLGYQVDWFRSMMVGSLILTRFVIVVNLVPFLFGRPVPAMLRQIIAILFTLLIFPVVVDLVPVGIERDNFFVLALFAKEILYGMAIGLSAAMIFYGFDAAGQIIDAQRGASMAQIFSPQTGTQVTVFGQFAFQLGVVLFLTLGGHQLFLYSLFDSFRLLPIYELPDMGAGFAGMIELFIRISGDVLLIGAQLAAPIIISIFVVDLILGVMNRISPAVNVLTLGFTIRAITGVIIFFVSISVVAHQMEILSVESMQSVKRTIQFMSEN